jgi:hypothetical protein
MNAGNDFSGVLSLLVWATLLPLVIVLVMRSRHRNDTPPEEESSEPQGESPADRPGNEEASKVAPGADSLKQDGKNPLS